MNFPWAICLAPEDAGSLFPLRLEKGIEIAVANSFIWLRGSAGEEGLVKQLRKVPAQSRYEWLADDRLRRLEERIPSMRLPAMTWVPLSRWLDVELTAAAFPAVQPDSLPLRLERSGEELEADIILTTMETWQTFVRCSSRIRLQKQAFAVAGDGRVLVRGRPLPSVPGSRFVLHGRVAIAAGYAWRPAVDLVVMERCLKLGAGEMIVWGVDGFLARIHTEQWIPATRPAMRATVEALEPEP